MQNRYFASDPAQNRVAVELYESVKDLPLICPHGHVDPRLFVDPDYQFGSPVDLLIIPDHYIFRMLYSQGTSLEALGIPAFAWRGDCKAITGKFGSWSVTIGICSAPRQPAFGCAMNSRMSSASSSRSTAPTRGRFMRKSPPGSRARPFRPRALYDRFNIEVLATTDAATDTLEHHQAILDSGWQGRIIPTFRPDAVIAIDQEGWSENIELLE